jgi:spore coat polysaccharide biosynthesis protein SpsF
MVKVLAIVQARMGSSRLPGKVLKEILGRPVLWHLINRLKQAKLINQIIIATSDNDRDEPIVRFAEENGIACYAGSESDLVDRLYQAAKRCLADAIVRITADCPLVDPVLVDRIIKLYLDSKGSLDYVSNINPRTYPDGLDVEIFSFQALKKVWEEVKDPFRREWITTNFFEHPEEYRLGNLEHGEDLSHLRWTLDYQEDLDCIVEIYKRLYLDDRVFLMKDILVLLREHPELSEINKSYAGEDGYIEAKRRMIK